MSHLALLQHLVRSLTRLCPPSGDLECPCDSGGFFLYVPTCLDTLAELMHCTFHGVNYNLCNAAIVQCIQA